MYIHCFSPSDSELKLYSVLNIFSCLTSFPRYHNHVQLLLILVIATLHHCFGASKLAVSMKTYTCGIQVVLVCFVYWYQQRGQQCGVLA